MEHDAGEPPHQYVPLSVSEAAAQFGVTPGTVRAHLRQGTLPGEKTEGTWVVYLPITRPATATVGANPEGGPAAPTDTGYPYRTGLRTRLGQQVTRLLVLGWQRLRGYLGRIPRRSVCHGNPTDT